MNLCFTLYRIFVVLAVAALAWALFLVLPWSLRALFIAYGVWLYARELSEP